MESMNYGKEYLVRTRAAEEMRLCRGSSRWQGQTEEIVNSWYTVMFTRITTYSAAQSGYRSDIVSIAGSTSPSLALNWANSSPRFIFAWQMGCPGYHPSTLIRMPPWQQKQMRCCMQKLKWDVWGNEFSVNFMPRQTTLCWPLGRLEARVWYETDRQNVCAQLS